jgi:hypothetical protein
MAFEILWEDLRNHAAWSQPRIKVRPEQVHSADTKQEGLLQ